MKTEFDYTPVGDICIPNLISINTNYQLGLWGQRHKEYLKQNHKIVYYNLLTNGKLNSYLHNVDIIATEMYNRLVKQLAEKQGLTEQLKADDMVAGVDTLNSISNCATDIVNAEVIYSFSNSIKHIVVTSKNIQSYAIGRWGRLHLDYIKEKSPQLFDKLLKSNHVYQYLEGIECLAQSEYEKIECEYRKVGCRISDLIAEEIVLQDIIYHY